MNKPTTKAAEAFMSRKPTFIGRVNGIDLYEHPVYGDESPLVAMTAEGLVKRTSNWELPDAMDGVDFEV